MALTGVDILGIVAGVIQIADVGARLSVKLSSYARKVKNADLAIRDISQDVALTCSVLSELGNELKNDEAAKLCSDRAMATAQSVIDECTVVFTDLEAALDKNAPRDINAFKKWAKKIKYPFIEPQIDLLRTNLERLKSTLLLMLNVIMKANSRELQDQRELINLLNDEMKANKEKVAELSTSVEGIAGIGTTEKAGSLGQDSHASTTLQTLNFNTLLPAPVKNSATKGVDEAVVSAEILAQGSGELDHYCTLIRAILHEVHAAKYRIDEWMRARIRDSVLEAHEYLAPYFDGLHDEEKLLSTFESMLKVGTTDVSKSPNSESLENQGNPTEYFKAIRLVGRDASLYPSSVPIPVATSGDSADLCHGEQPSSEDDVEMKEEPSSGMVFEIEEPPRMYFRPGDRGSPRRSDDSQVSSPRISQHTTVRKRVHYDEPLEDTKKHLRRLPREDELRAIEQYVRHARSCPKCAYPFEGLGDRRILCREGHSYAKNVAEYFHLKAGAVYSENDLTNTGSLVQIELLAEYDVIRDLLKAFDLGLKRRKIAHIVSQDRHYYVPDRLPLLTARRHDYDQVEVEPRRHFETSPGEERHEQNTYPIHEEAPSQSQAESAPESSSRRDYPEEVSWGQTPGFWLTTKEMDELSTSHRYASRSTSAAIPESRNDHDVVPVSPDKESKKNSASPFPLPPRQPTPEPDNRLANIASIAYTGAYTEETLNETSVQLAISQGMEQFRKRNNAVDDLIRLWTTLDEDDLRIGRENVMPPSLPLLLSDQ